MSGSTFVSFYIPIGITAFEGVFIRSDSASSPLFIPFWKIFNVPLCYATSFTVIAQLWWHVSLVFMPPFLLTFAIFGGTILLRGDQL